MAHSTKSARLWVAPGSWWEWLIAFALLFALLILTSCAHVTPTIDNRQTIPYDGNVQNGGIVRWIKVDGLPALEITAGKLAEYNALVDKYGDQTTPKTPTDFGTKKLGNGNYSMTLQAAERFYALILIAERTKINKSR